MRYILLTLGTAYMAFSSVRGFLFFVIFGSFPIAYYLKNIEISEINNNVTKKTMLLRKILIGIIIILISFGAYSSVNISGVSDQDYNSLNDTIEFILKNEDISNVKLYTGYNDGGLAEFKGIPSYIDTRAEVFEKKIIRKMMSLKNIFSCNQEPYIIKMC